MDILAGTAASVLVTFAGPDGTTIPDTGSVTYSLYGQTGASLVTGQALSVPAEHTSTTVSIPSNLNSIASGKRFEKRTLIVSWLSGGQSYFTTIIYRLRPLTLYTASPEDVRSFFGYREDELRDEEIDLFEAYLSLSAQFDDGVLDAGHRSAPIDQAPNAEGDQVGHR